MAKIALVDKKIDTISKILLDSHEICPINDCGHSQGCAGKNGKRDNDFICDLAYLIALYKKNGREK